MYLFTDLQLAQKSKLELHLRSRRRLGTGATLWLEVAAPPIFRTGRMRSRRLVIGWHRSPPTLVRNR